MAITVRSDGVRETPGEREAHPEIRLNPSPASSSEERAPSPSMRPGLRGPGGSGSDRVTGGGGVNGHVTDWLIPTLPRLTSPPLIGHVNTVRSEKRWHRAIAIEDFKKIDKHHPLNLGSGDGGGQLNGTPDEVGMRCRKELDPVDR